MTAHSAVECYSELGNSMATDGVHRREVTYKGGQHVHTMPVHFVGDRL